MPARRRHYLTRQYSPREEVVAGLVIALIAFAVRYVLDPVLSGLLPFTMSIVCSSLAALLIGWRCAVVHATLSFFVCRYFFVAPRHTLVLQETTHFAVLASYVALSALLIYAGHRARRAELELGGANDRLRQDDAAKDRFLLALAHELRGPFQVVLNSLALIRATGKASADVADQVDLIERQMRGADRIVEDLLDLERVRRGSLSLQLKPLDIRICVEESLQRCEGAIVASGQRLSVSLPPEPVLGCVDRQRMVQIISNLLENAVKYAGAKATVSVRVEEAGDSVRLVVRDDGAGVPGEALARLMEQRDTAVVAPGGFGVGLRLCAQLARAQKGRFEVRSDKGRGFEATLEFDRFVVPARQSERTDAEPVA